MGRPRSGHSWRCACRSCRVRRAKHRRAARRAEVEAMRGECWCGAAKAPAAEACPTCLYLDQPGAAGAVVWALRGLGGRASTCEVAAEAGLSVRQVLRLCARLRAVGRVARREADSWLREADGDSPPVEWELRVAPQ